MPVFPSNEIILLGFGFSPGPPEMLLIMVIALLLYGGRLPEVARTWGKSFADFRHSLSGIKSEINEAIYAEPDRLEYHAEYADDGYVDENLGESELGDAECSNAESGDADSGDADSGDTEQPKQEPPTSEQ